MKIFVNAYLENNLGDDLFMDILLNRYPEHEFYALSSYYKDNRKNSHIFSNEFLIKIIRKLKIKSMIANRCDLAVTIGGSMYMEKEGIKPCFSLGKKEYYILGTNFGPYKTDEYYKQAQHFFSKAQDVCFRESYSYNLFSTLENVRYASDIVFSLDISDIKVEEKKKAIFSIISCERKANSKYTEQYEQTVINLTKFLINNGYEICFMSFCKKEGDEDAIRSILEKCDEDIRENVKTYYYRGNIKEALEEIASSQLILGGRFHANILGMLFGKTVIPMMYSDKTKHVLEDMNFNGKILDIRHLDNFDVCKDIKQEHLNYKQDINYQIKDAEKHFAKLDKKLKKE